MVGLRDTDIQKWKKKKERAQIDGNLDSVYFACKELAELYFNTEKYDLALEEYKEMERISEMNGNLMDVGRANRMIGEVFCEKGEFEKAIRHQMKHLELARVEENQVEEQRALATLGRTYFLQAESSSLQAEGLAPPGSSPSKEAALAEAKKYYMESLAISQKLSESEVGHKQRMEMIARLFLNIGLVLDCQNHFESAIDHMQKAVSICKKLDLWEDLYRTYSALGGAYQKRGDSNLSIRTYDLGLSVAERLSNKTQLMCDLLILKSDALLDLPDARGARQSLLKAYKLRAPDQATRREVEKKLRIVALMCECERKLTELSSSEGESDEERKKLYEEMGDAAAELGHFKLALVYYHLMLECVEKAGCEDKSLIDSYISLAQTYKDDRQYTKALEYFQKELKLEEKNSPEACKTLLNIAEVYGLLGKRREMYTAYEEARVGALLSTDTKLKVSALSLLHSALLEDGKLTQADAVRKELDGLEADIFADSSDSEEESERVQLGAHISLDQLTDEEGGGGPSGGGGQGEEEKSCRGSSRAARGKRQSSNLERRNEKGETPLHLAAISGNATLVSKLLDQGHRVDVKDYSGWTPLHEASNHGHTEVVRLLLARGAPINDRGGPHCDGVTPLLDAASNGNLDILQLLLDSGASPLMRTNSGDSVLDCLSGWRQRRHAELGADLSGSTLAQYTTIYKKLANILENAGQKLCGEPPLPKSDKPAASLSLKKSPGLLRPSRRTSSGERKSRESKPSGVDEYETAMNALRFRNSENKPENKGWEVAGGADRPVIGGLLTESQTVGDDWLEDDLGGCRLPPSRLPPSKRRRTGCESFITGTSAKEYRPLSPGSPPPFSTESDGGAPSPRSENIEDSSDSNPLPSSPPKPRSSECLKRKQLSLGVVRRKSAERPPHESVSSLPSTVPPQSQPVINCVKVKIEDKTVIVPVPGSGEGLTISWLASQAAARYKCLEGGEPVLQLEMAGGGLLLPSDPLSLLLLSGGSSFQQPPLLEARVLSWLRSSPRSLYLEACQALSTDCDEEVEAAIDGCEGTGRVSIEELYLSWKQIAPLLRALSHYQPLQALVLASNNISDLHIMEVGESVCKLPHLKTLDLTNINITAKGLDKFAQTITKSNGLKWLEELRLGHNPLTGDCSRALSSLLAAAGRLRLLHIPDIGLTSRALSSLTALSSECLEEVDASYNELGGEGVRGLLGLLNHRTLTRLELAGCGAGALREVGFYLEQRAPPLLTHLDLSYCVFSPPDLLLLKRGAEMCERLETIELNSSEALPGGALTDLLSLRLESLGLCSAAGGGLLELEGGSMDTLLRRLPLVGSGGTLKELALTSSTSPSPLDSSSSSSLQVGPYGLVVISN